MRAYLVKTTKDVETLVKKYAGSQSEAAAVKKEIQEAHSLKRTQVGFDEVEIPTDKAGLIGWINKNLVG